MSVIRSSQRATHPSAKQAANSEPITPAPAVQTRRRAPLASNRSQKRRKEVVEISDVEEDIGEEEEGSEDEDQEPQHRTNNEEGAESDGSEEEYR